MFWHLPLFLTGQILAPDVLVIIAANVLIAIFLHAANNAVSGSYASQLFHGSDAIRLGLPTAAGWVAGGRRDPGPRLEAEPLSRGRPALGRAARIQEAIWARVVSAASSRLKRTGSSKWGA